VSNAIDAIGPAGARVVRTGFVSDATLAALYRAATCVVLASVEEGFGLPAVEAMASGTPLVAANTPALRELCGSAADYVDRPEDLAGALAHLIDRPSELDRLRAAGPRQAARFSWGESARRLMAAFDRAARARAGELHSAEHPISRATHQP